MWRNKCNELRWITVRFHIILFWKLRSSYSTIEHLLLVHMLKPRQFAPLTSWHLCHEYDDFLFQLISGGVSWSRNICHHQCKAYRFFTTNVSILTLITRASYQPQIHLIHCCALRKTPTNDQWFSYIWCGWIFCNASILVGLIHSILQWIKGKKLYKTHRNHA